MTERYREIDYKKILQDTLEKYGIDKADNKAEVLVAYMEGILEKNKFINLTSVNDRQTFIYRHYIDSFGALNVDALKGADKIIDVGTGGGFPGIALCVAFPKKEWVLIDSLAKRLHVIDELTDKLNIKHVRLIHGRAEELARQSAYRESFDCCLSRAVADLAVLSEYCLPFVKEGGSFLAYKTADAEDEIKNASRAIRILGGEVKNIHSYRYEEKDQARSRLILEIEKIKKTPSKYPRRPGMPSKKPL